MSNTVHAGEPMPIPAAVTDLIGVTQYAEEG